MSHAKNINPEVKLLTSIDAYDDDETRQLTQKLLSQVATPSNALLTAVELSKFLHREQYRTNSDGSKSIYSTHPLRVATNVYELTGDEELAVVGLLHDTVEDCSHSFVEDMITATTIGVNIELETSLMFFLSNVFTERVVRTVNGLTVSYEVEVIRDREQRTAQYHAHVSESVRKNVDVLLVKMCDFIDNAGGLNNYDVNHRNHRTAQRLARKYSPLVELFQECLDDFLHDGSLSQEVYDVFFERVSLIGNKLKLIV